MDSTNTNSASSNKVKESQKKINNKKFRWTNKMVSQIIEFLTVHESKMELHNKDFGKDRSVQYKETIREENEKIRKSLVKIQEKNLKN